MWQSSPDLFRVFTGNECFPFCIAFKLLQIILLEGVAVSASALLLIIDGSLGLVLMANW